MVQFTDVRISLPDERKRSVPLELAAAPTTPIKINPKSLAPSVERTRLLQFSENLCAQQGRERWTDVY
jgi:hypothetical protein